MIKYVNCHQRNKRVHELKQLPKSGCNTLNIPNAMIYRHVPGMFRT
ncbi:hypothetical protein BVRB_8g190080 [Beta vulgaris subsp. vulgaris]|nr:hypothetical protein BVRB_8g190080 [Beta vulgaris subsp. vulgaris]